MTEDQVREKAARILEFDSAQDENCGVGQLTTFNQLGFVGKKDKPDGWYLPKNLNEVAIILEVKKSGVNICAPKCVDELLKNVRIALTRYKKVVGVLYNGEDVVVYKNTELANTAAELQNKRYYLQMFDLNHIDKQKIYCLTKRINDNLHFNFKVNNLKHRMIFTAGKYDNGFV